MSQPIIEVQNLSKRYRLGRIGATTLRDDAARLWNRLKGREPAVDKGDFWALRDVSFNIFPGEVVGIIGRNGAGKSTLLKILSRITEPTSGRAILRGRVASLLEVGTGFHPDLTGRENVYLNGAILGMKAAEVTRRFDEIVAFAEVEKFIDTPVKHYSSGMRVRLAFAVASHLDSDVLIVDEVLAVGDAQFQRRCRDRMQAVSRDSRTVIYVSHELTTVQNLCSHALVMDAGSLVARGESAEMIDHYLALSGAHANTGQAHRLLAADTTSKLRELTVEQSGQIAPVLHPGIPTEIVLRIAGLHGPAADLTVRLTVETESGLIIARMLTPSGATLLTDGGGGLRCRLPELPLTPGRYWLSYSLWRKAELIERGARCLTLHVVAPPDDALLALPARQRGLFRIAHDWAARGGE